MRIAIVGGGRMGQAVVELATARHHDITTVVRGAENVDAQALTTDRLGGADVVVEFSRPEAVVANLERLVDLGLPVVTGTTGWAAELSRITQLVDANGGALLHAPNFSTGVALLLRAATDLAAAWAAGCRRVLVRTGKGAATAAAIDPGLHPVAVFADLAAAVDALLKEGAA